MKTRQIWKILKASLIRHHLLLHFNFSTKSFSSTMLRHVIHWTENERKRDRKMCPRQPGVKTRNHCFAFNLFKMVLVMIQCLFIQHSTKPMCYLCVFFLACGSFPNNNELIWVFFILFKKNEDEKEWLDKYLQLARDALK